MSRRRPGAKKAYLSSLATCLLVLPWGAFASLQQEQVYHGRSQPEDGGDPERIPASGDIKQDLLDTQSYQHFKQTSISSNKPSAIATFAPAVSSAVRAPKPAQGSGRISGSTSLLNARSLQDWVVEDFVLLATVDGSIYAKDREKGTHRWALQVDNPMIETIYHRANKSELNDYRPEDDFLWIVEPSKDGDIYIYNQGSNGGLQRLRLTVKKLAEELSPFAGDEPAVVYTAEKRTTLFTVDAATGIITKTFSSSGSRITDTESCRRMNPLDGEEKEEGECGNTGSLILGRTEYIVGIQHKDTAEPICTLKFSEWGPNNRDSDLHSQYSTTMDQKYVYTRHDGQVLGFDHVNIGGDESGINARPSPFKLKLPSPVARVFDVARPVKIDGEDAPKDAQLAVLPQPIGPIDFSNIYNTVTDKSRVFVNRTEAGGWFALSEHSYPLVTSGASKAPIYNQDWLDLHFPPPNMPLHQQQDALVGIHSLSDKPRDGTHQLLTISGPSEDNDKREAKVNDSASAKSEPSPISSAFAIKNSRIIQGAANNGLDIVISLFAILVVMFLTVNHKLIGRFVRKRFDMTQYPSIAKTVSSPPTSPILPSAPKLGDLTAPGVDVNDFASKDPTTPIVTTLEKAPRSRSESISSDQSSEKAEARVRFADSSTSELPEEEDEGNETPVPTKSKNDESVDTPTPAKKKARRGCRGGTKHKKKNNKNGQNNKQVDEADAVEQAVQDALELVPVQAPPIEPEVESVKNTTVTDVSGPVIQIGHLKVDTEKILGFGSHGTVVYQGSFGGRDVAVKRMLQDFYDIASHEVGLLQESDDHPNVIRYYDKESAGQFLYIALELCPASLQDVIEKSHSFPNLIGPSGLDLPDVLRQITSGLQYLHSLKIVHRDIKPQNILVSAPKRLPRNPDAFQPPRLLISDFGLCKKLEGDQSSFRATTAHAAGTSGWRAPELLVDEDAVSNATASQSSMPASGHSNSEPLVLDTQSNRRATRAIDVFSLGCVFYYVLTGGSHPFDRDGKFMREGNIIKGNYSIDELDRLGDFQWEAKDLVSRMLDLDPKGRPDAATILAHPFFWNAQQRLDFLCHVSDQFEFEPRDPPSVALQALESWSPHLLSHCKNDFLSNLPQTFKDTLGKQRKYTGNRILDLLRALRNKKNHYEDMPDDIKKKVGPLPDGYLGFWTRRFPGLLMACHEIVIEVGWTEKDRFKSYYKAA